MEGLRCVCEVPLDRLRLVASEMQEQMRAGLAADGHMLKMLPTYVTRLPDGRAARDCVRPWLTALCVAAPSVAATTR
jgi:hexokinase